MSSEKGPLVVEGSMGDDKLPRYIGDYFIKHYKDPVLKQPVFHGT